MLNYKCIDWVISNLRRGKTDKHNLHKFSIEIWIYYWYYPKMSKVKYRQQLIINTTCRKSTIPFFPLRLIYTDTKTSIIETLGTSWSVIYNFSPLGTCIRRLQYFVVLYYIHYQMILFFLVFSIRVCTRFRLERHSVFCF